MAQRSPPACFVPTHHDRASDTTRARAHTHTHTQAGFSALRAIDGKIEGSYGAHGEVSHTGWAYGSNQLEHALWLVSRPPGFNKCAR